MVLNTFPVPVPADSHKSQNSGSHSGGEARESTRLMKGFRRLQARTLAAGNTLSCCPNCGYPWFDCVCHPQWNAAGNTLTANTREGSTEQDTFMKAVQLRPCSPSFTLSAWRNWKRSSCRQLETGHGTARDAGSNPAALTTFRPGQSLRSLLIIG